LVFSAGHLTASYDITARVWDAQSGQSLAVLKGHDAWVNTAAFSPDGQRVVTASLDKRARVWDAQSGKSLADGEQGDRSVRSVGAFAMENPP
jgi:WD40 repeat protein